MNKIYNALSIAGTDPIGGAGIQADLKTFSAFGVYCTTVITSLVAQNTLGVQSIYHIDSNFVLSQMESVFADINIDVIKIGMLGKSEIIKVVAKKLKEFNNMPWIVLDTVMTAKSGDILLDNQAIVSLRDILLPIVSVITPNLPEAATLLNCRQAKNEKEMYEQGRDLLNLGCKVVLIKGGHLNTEIIPNLLISSDYEIKFSNNRIMTNNTHGTGCTLSSALAATRLTCKNWPEALEVAISWLQQTIYYSNMLNIGQGNGPVHHFHKWWKLDKKSEISNLKNKLSNRITVTHLK